MKKLISKKLVVIVGPTASGKSDLGVKLALRLSSGQAKKQLGLNGAEIVSADSRQVYKGLDIGSGKITKKEMMGIPHHLLDVVSLKRQFSVAAYQKLAIAAVKDIQSRGKLPIVVGGTPYYVYAVVDNFVFPDVKANPKLRADLEKLSLPELLQKLQKLDPERLTALQQSSGQDKNKRRIIRSLEIIMATGKPVPKLSKLKEDGQPPLFKSILIGTKKSSEELKERIHRRLVKRLKHGMLEEVEWLHAHSGMSWKRFEELGLEYKYTAQYLQGKITKQEMTDFIQKESEQFVRRQMLWFKRDPRIHWIENQTDAELIVKTFLGK